ncbi:MAG TPA: mechanosensitive ion channel domain-containing protein [Croceibacterium sp.]|nr:mechanosensitive ion channel domain-containing protein [Croceibacterium sp.]
MSQAADILHNVDRGSDLWIVIATLDKWGFTVADTRISLWTVLVALVVIVLALVLARLSIRAACWVLGRMTTLDPGQRLLAQKLISIAIWVATFLLAIDIIGIDLTALAVFSGAFGLALGFGLQKTFGNLLAGIILLMDKSIKPGDVIAVNDGISNTVGQVKKIGIRAVSVTTRDKKEYLIPNENLMINQVENWSYSSKDVRIKVPVIVAPTSDLELAEQLMLEAALACPRVLRTRPAAVWITEFAEAGVAFEIRFWIQDPEEGLASVRSDVLKGVWQRFTEHGIKLPDPAERNLYLKDTPALQELLAAVRRYDAATGKTG